MTTSGAATHGGTAREPVEVVVALEHAPLVLGALGRHGVTDVESRDSGLLGLTLVRGTFDRDAASGAAGTSSASGAGADRPEPTDADVLLLKRLRDDFEHLYGGWSPTMGRNRFLGQADEEVTGGGGTVSHGGGSDPVPAAARRRPRGLLGQGITVGVLDTAIVAHPDLAGGYVATSPRDLLPAADPAEIRAYAAGHATFVAGLVLDQAPGATVRVRRILDEDGAATSWDVANAIVELGRTGVQILNLSLVCYTDDAKPPLALSAAIDRLDPDILVVACAGNHGDPRLRLPAEKDYAKPSWPAALDDVVAVGSARRTGAGTTGPGYEISPFTPRRTAWIDVVTHGEDLTSTYFSGTGSRTVPTTVNPRSERHFDGWARWSGTSFSAALLAGKVAAVASTNRVPPRTAYRELMASGVHPLGLADPGTPPFLDL